MGGRVTFDPFSAPVDYIELQRQRGGTLVRSPGLATVNGPALDYNFTVPEGEGVSGADPIFHGRPLSKFTVDFRLFNSEEVAAWELFVTAIRYPESLAAATVGQAGVAVPAFDISHPQVASYGIRAAFVTHISPLKQDANNIWTAAIEFLEHRKPRPMKARVDSQGPPEDPDATDAANKLAQIAALQAAKDGKEHRLADSPIAVPIRDRQVNGTITYRPVEN
jgi:hypothetical protein